MITSRYLLEVKLKFIDLAGAYEASKDSIDQAILRVLDHGQYVFGPEITELEQQLASYVGVKHCVALSSGTTALEVALMALNIGHGDEVITSSFSFFATAEAIVRVGATPVFVDIDPKTYNINHTLIESAITDRTKAIMPISLYGQLSDMRAINEIANRHNLHVVEDGAQSFGASCHGKMSCGLSTIGCTSFFPSKPLGCYGDGGACFTNDTALAEKMRCLINHGQSERYIHSEIGFNGRISSIQAAVLLQKVVSFKEDVAMRQQVASWYKDELNESLAPVLVAGNVSVYGQYTVRVKNREKVQLALKEQGIPTATHYPKGMHQQIALQPYLAAAQVELPHTENAALEVLSLPFYPCMPRSDVMQVAQCLNSIVIKEELI